MTYFISDSFAGIAFSSKEALKAYAAGRAHYSLDSDVGEISWWTYLPKGVIFIA